MICDPHNCIAGHRCQPPLQHAHHCRQTACVLRRLCAQGDPFRTLFVSRLSYEIDEKRLRREFAEFGPIKRLRIVTDKAGEG